MKIRLPNSYYNFISYAGTAIALIGLFMFVFLYVLSSISTIEKAYAGIVIFIVIPAFIILGLVMIPLGMIRKIQRQKKGTITPGSDFPILDLNKTQHRNATLIFSIGTIFFLFLSALGSYEAYHYTESVKFCGTLCHNLMIPEYTAYQNSPHARVTCAECHVGAGANWYVKSKLSGLYQVYATLANNYPRPIPTPIRNLRPARETCEECHWPQKVYGKQQRKEIYFLSDERNTRWDLDLLMHTGGGNPALGQSAGIHWHINPDIKIEYIATDEKRLVIPQVVLTDLKTGEKTVYNNQSIVPEDGQLTQYQPREMDCIDCHNRPSHIYRDPSRFINIALAAGEIDSTLPDIKRVAVEACIGEYESTPEAVEKIAEKVRTYYQESHPDHVALSRLDQSISGIQNAFKSNIFPEMKVRWEHYLDHIGHMTSPGCFRCHDGQHATEDGTVISHGCNDCHTIAAQGPVNQMEFMTGRESLEFKHPVDIDDAWRETGCSECHAAPPI